MEEWAGRGLVAFTGWAVEAEHSVCVLPNAECLRTG